MKYRETEGTSGSHIQCLHMTNFYRIMRPIIEAGYVYAACPPLFTLHKNNEVKYLLNDAELKEFNSEGWTILRNKG